jgi:hypothetical protein
VEDVPPAATVLPSGENATELTPSSSAVRNPSADFPVVALQSSSTPEAVFSLSIDLPPSATNFPSVENATALIELLATDEKDFVCDPDEAFHKPMRNESTPSTTMPEPLAIVDPSSEYATAEQANGLLVSIERESVEVVTLQNSMAEVVLSLHPAPAIVFPSGENVKVARPLLDGMSRLVASLALETFHSSTTVGRVVTPFSCSSPQRAIVFPSGLNSTVETPKLALVFKLDFSFPVGTLQSSTTPLPVEEPPSARVKPSGEKLKESSPIEAALVSFEMSFPDDTFHNSIPTLSPFPPSARVWLSAEKASGPIIQNDVENDFKSL